MSEYSIHNVDPESIKVTVQRYSDFVTVTLSARTIKGEKTETVLFVGPKSDDGYVLEEQIAEVYENLRKITVSRY